MKNGASFEGYVHYVYETLLNLKGERVQVSRRTRFRLASGESYEIDIYYEFYHVNVRHRVAIECKNWSAPVDQGRVLEFHQKIKNIGDDIVGVIISASGYQAGALAVARRHGILALSATDLPQLNHVVAARIKTALLPEVNCVGEPFWYIAEVSKEDFEGTGNYYAFKDGPVKILLFISQRHATAYLKLLPDQSELRVFGMPQYKLDVLLALSIPQKVVFGLVFNYPDENGNVAVTPITAARLKTDFLLSNH